MKRFLSGGSNKGEHRKEPKPAAYDAEEKDGGFPTLDGCLMIFGGLAAYDSKHRSCVPQGLYSRADRTYLPSMVGVRHNLQWTNHPECIPLLGQYLLMVDLIIGTKRLTKVLMDGGSGLNIMYAKTLDAMGID